MDRHELRYNTGRLGDEFNAVLFRRDAEGKGEVVRYWRVDLADERRKLLRVAPKGRALLQRVNLMNKSRGE